MSELERDRIFEFLERELPAKVWEISKLSNVDRHQRPPGGQLVAE